MAQLRAHVFRAGKPVFVMEISEIAGALLSFIQISERNVQPHGPVAERGPVEDAGFHFEARIEAHCPFHHITLAAWFGLTTASCALSRIHFR